MAGDISLFTPEDIIYAYTRQDAVADGSQVLLSGKLADLAKEAGLLYPVYITSAVSNLMERAIANRRHANDEQGILWDIFSVYTAAVRGVRGNPETVYFVVAIAGAARQRNWRFAAQVGPTDIDKPEPAITFMLADELGI